MLPWPRALIRQSITLSRVIALSGPEQDAWVTPKSDAGAGGRVELGYDGWWGCRDPCGIGIQDELPPSPAPCCPPPAAGPRCSRRACLGRGTGTLGLGRGAGRRGHMGIFARTAAPTGSHPPTPAEPCQQATHTQDRLPAPPCATHTVCSPPCTPHGVCAHSWVCLKHTYHHPFQLRSPGERARHSR